MNTPKPSNVLELFHVSKKSKAKTFGYFLTQLKEWRNDVGTCKDESISILKAIKLLFFASAAHTPMLEIFDDYVAIPYGHVESDVYEMYKKIKNKYQDKSLDAFESLGNGLSDSKKQIIDAAIVKLKEHNSNLVCMRAFDLVELSHKWYSWNIFFKNSKSLGIKPSTKIPKDFIINERKYYE